VLLTLFLLQIKELFRVGGVDERWKNFVGEPLVGSRKTNPILTGERFLCPPDKGFIL
jgi:hypothetical protein